MDSNTLYIPDNAIAAASRGDLVEAIKLTRAATGLGLKEAKDAVEAYIAGNRVAISSSPSTNFEFPTLAITALQSGNTIEAIKIVRAEGGLGLKEAKDMVDRYLSQNPIAKSRSHTIARDNSPQLGKMMMIALLAAGVVVAILAMIGKL